MNPYIEILRPGNAIMAAIAVVLMIFVGHNYNVPVLVGALLVFIITGAGNAINDVYDYKIDAINKPHRPIPSGRISLKNARIYAISLFLVSILISIVISYLVNSYWPAVIVVCAAILMYVYASHLKAMPLIGNIVVATLTCFCFIFAGTIIACDTGYWFIFLVSIYLGLFALFMTLAREIIKDMEDIEGDKADGAKTFPIIMGKKIPSIVSIILIVVTTLMCPILYIYHIFNLAYMIIMIIPIIMFLYSAYTLGLNPDTETCGKVSKWVKIAMLISFIAFVVGSFNFGFFAYL
ncbi:MAG: UbiA family prenyltransferase [Methanobacteriaceae archaeon]|nr:UbiA family prenyltransferase [Methanobacteriaceae archaeon]